ncbi:MAG: aminopeptidase [Gammaproteobacteria bacterium]|nr:aminopeptidase [Gammaproteobacteria bacterium]
MSGQRVVWRLLAVMLILTTAGCTSVSYYSQSVTGHLALISSKRPVSAWLADEESSPELKRKLRLSQEILHFAHSEMALPDNGSYRHYIDSGQKYIVWNVVATPEFSLQPLQPCFWIVGCLSYRGYYARESAEALAAEYRLQGLDVMVGGSRAYSTLGWLSDPLLNTLLTGPDWALAEVMFHELAHQRLYIDDDSAFNEAFATAVAEEGVQRWLQQQGEEAEIVRYLKQQQRRRQFNQLLLTTRGRLQQLYRSEQPSEALRSEKKRLFTTLQQEYAQLQQLWDGYSGYDRWMERALNNAHLAQIATYYEQVPCFQKMIEESGGEMERFYLQAAQFSTMARRCVA